MNTIALTQAAWREKCGFAFPASLRNEDQAWGAIEGIMAMRH